MASLKTLQLKANPQASFPSIEHQARELIRPQEKNLTLIAWWDSTRGIGGPQEVCSDESISCVTAYAVGHGSKYQVDVNGGQYDFFYGAPAGEFTELDARMVEEVHRYARRNDFDDVQGG
jgi:hypothetical protein